MSKHDESIFAQDTEIVNGAAVSVYKIGGLTKLEYFSGLAMQGLLSNENNCHFMQHEIAAFAVDSATVLLDELEKRKK